VNDRAHQPVPWSLGGSPEFEEALRGSFLDEQLDDGSDQVRWTCPRCGHEHVRNFFREERWAGLTSGGTREEELAIKCECGLEHPGRPEGEVGCGYRTVLVLEEEEA
jgi:hypothetical protein